MEAALDRFAMYVEQGHNAISSAIADPAERALLKRLRGIGALLPSGIEAPPVCPICEAQVAEAVDVNIARCSSCGLVDCHTDDQLRWMPDVDWLIRRIAQALGLFKTRPLPIVEDHVWRIGDIGRGAHRRRILFGRRVDTLDVHALLHAGWGTYVGDTAALMITTTPMERLGLLLRLLPVQVVPLLFAFQLVGSGLAADSAIWRGVLRPTAPVSAVRRGLFSSNFRLVWLPNAPDPVVLTPLQAAIFRVLWNLDGAWIRGDELMQRCGSEDDKPVGVFRRLLYPDAHHVYRQLVQRRRGWYRLHRAEPYG